MLAAAAGNSAHFFDLRASGKIGCYGDQHTDTVTQVCFNPYNEAELATGSEDGLSCVYDCRQSSSEASLQCVLNAGCAVRRVGFFAPGGEGVFLLTGSENCCLFHKQTAQCINSVSSSDTRALLAPLGINYLVDARFNSESGRLELLCGNWDGGLHLCEATDSTVTPLATLAQGHSAVVRCAAWGSGGSIITGGEDSRLCVWGLHGPQAPTSSAAVPPPPPSSVGGMTKKTKARANRGAAQRGGGGRAAARESSAPY